MSDPVDRGGDVQDGSSTDRADEQAGAAAGEGKPETVQQLT